VIAFISPLTWEKWLLGGLAILFLGLIWFFSSLTVEADGREVRWYFGPGLWTYRIPLTDIASASVVRNSWMHGFGIRVGRGFRLYNVSGLDAVELKLRNGDICRLGSDDAARLAAALQS
jgi:hypothetical protein